MFLIISLYTSYFKKVLNIFENKQNLEIDRLKIINFAKSLFELVNLKYNDEHLIYMLKIMNPNNRVNEYLANIPIIPFVFNHLHISDKINDFYLSSIYECSKKIKIVSCTIKSLEHGEQTFINNFIYNVVSAYNNRQQYNYSFLENHSYKNQNNPKDEYLLASLFYFLHITHILRYITHCKL